VKENPVRSSKRFRRAIPTRTILAALAVAGLGACGGQAGQQSNADGTRNTGSLTLASGTQIEATTLRTISSRTDKAGQTFTARITNDVKDDRGRVAIPAGATLNMTITQLQSATDKSKADGKITVLVRSVTVGTMTYPISAGITSMAHSLKGRGVGESEVEKTAAGVIIGGIAGRVIGGDASGTVIGAVVGGAAGAAVAVETANRDVVVAVGTPIVVTLNGPLALAVK
jgi:hypothetical protein